MNVELPGDGNIRHDVVTAGAADGGDWRLCMGELAADERVRQGRFDVRISGRAPARRAAVLVDEVVLVGETHRVPFQLRQHRQRR